MTNIPFVANDLPPRSMPGHCPIDPLNKACEKFFLIWSHKAVNICNDLIEYTIRRMQSDRLRFLFQTRTEFTQQGNDSPICQISIHTEDDLHRIKEHIRRFCLSTRNLYRHLRSDSRIYPKMSIDLDQSIMIKICRFIFKTKVLIEILSKEQHLNEQQREQLNKYKLKQVNKNFEINDPYRNITKAFIVLQSNFEILYGDILDRDFFQNAKQNYLFIKAVQTLPIILDISKTIRLIFCALYKISEPERQAEAKAIRQRRLPFHVRGYGSKNQGLAPTNIPTKNQESRQFKNMNELLNIDQSQRTHTSMVIPTKTQSSPPKTFSKDKTTNQPKTKTTESSKRIRSPKSRSRTPNKIISKTNKNQLLSPTPKRDHDSSKKSSTSERKKKNQTKSPSRNNKKQKKPTSKNKNASTTDSTLSKKHNENTISINNNSTTKNFENPDSSHTQASSKEKLGWTTWLHNATLSLATILPSNQTTNLNTNLSKPLLTTWASFDRISKI